MTTNPEIYIVAAGMLGATIGFFGRGLFVGREVRRANTEGWKEGSRFYARKMDEQRRCGGSDEGGVW